jgi:hypothetical protein
VRTNNHVTRPLLTAFEIKATAFFDIDAKACPASVRAAGKAIGPAVSLRVPPVQGAGGRRLGSGHPLGLPSPASAEANPNPLRQRVELAVHYRYLRRP